MQWKPWSISANAGDEMMVRRVGDGGNVTEALWSDTGWNVKERVPVLIR